MDCYGNQNASGEDGNMKPSRNFSINTKNICKQCYNYFRKNGCSDAATKGILANIFTESGFNYKIIVWDINGISCGLIQFHWGGELNNLIKYDDNTQLSIMTQINNTVANNHKMAKNYDFSKYFSLDKQLEFIVKDILKRDSVKPILTMNSPALSTDEWMKKVERPRDKNQKRWQNVGNTIIKMLS